ncbi:MAG: hypothetical protein VYB15_00900 [Planctomycetota bacterium]|nr:hypothetical protein [Planctomycetota bacterium]
MSDKLFYSRVGKIFTLIVQLAAVLGGLVSLAWLGGSLFLYWQLDRPMWELASLVAVSLFVFSWFCVRESRRRGTVTPSADESWGESREEMEAHLAEIEEGLSEARRGGEKKKKKQIEELKEARKDMLSQLKRLELEDKIEELERLRDEASTAGRGSEAREYSKKIDRHKARLKGPGDHIEDMPRATRIFAYGMLTTFILTIALIPLFVSFLMIGVTVGICSAWADGSEWLRSPGWVAALIAGSLVLACVGVRVVSLAFSPEASGSGKESLWGERSK